MKIRLLSKREKLMIQSLERLHETPGTLSKELLLEYFQIENALKESLGLSLYNFIMYGTEEEETCLNQEEIVTLMQNG